MFLRAFPYASHQRTDLVAVQTLFLPLVWLLAWSGAIAVLARHALDDRQSGVHRLLSMHGERRAVQSAAWLSVSLVQFALALLPIAALCAYTVWRKSSATLIYTAMMCASATTVAQVGQC